MHTSRFFLVPLCSLLLIVLNWNMITKSFKEIIKYAPCVIRDIHYGISSCVAIVFFFRLIITKYSQGYRIRLIYYCSECSIFRQCAASIHSANFTAMNFFIKKMLWTVCFKRAIYVELWWFRAFSEFSARNENKIRKKRYKNRMAYFFIWNIFLITKLSGWE